MTSRARILSWNALSQCRTLHGQGDGARPVPDDALDDLLPPQCVREFRRASRIDKMLMASACRCIDRVGLDALRSARTGIFLGSAFSSVDESLNLHWSMWNPVENTLSPNSFVNTVGNAAPLSLARMLGGFREVVVVSQEDLSFEVALAAAIQRLADGSLDLALVGGGDVLAPSEDDHRARIFGEGSPFPEVPLSEGCAWLVLSAGPGGDHPVVDEPAFGDRAPATWVNGDTATLTSLAPHAGVALGVPPTDPRVRGGGYHPTCSAVRLCAWLDAGSAGPRRFRHCGATPSRDMAWLAADRR